ncbi:hypothetical protein BDW22DRAFT_1355384 [Trametopsis cervina]|nr:hypothetical protein BDW22DRAFT_1355384 [Trametopsis cervina]
MDGGTGFNVAPEVVDRFLNLKQLVAYGTAASMALVVWDFAMTFGLEVELVWCSPKSLPKVVYLLNRYMSILMASAYLLVLFVGEHTALRYVHLFRSNIHGTSSRIYADIFSDVRVYEKSVCRLANPIHSVGTALGFLNASYAWVATALVQAILQIWLYAIYRRARRRRCLILLSATSVVLCLMVAGFFITFASKLRFVPYNALCVDVLADTDMTQPVAKIIDDTMRTKIPPYLLVITMLWTMLTSILLGLIACKASLTYRNRDVPNAGLASILIRDSVVYCVLTFGLQLLNIFMVIFTPYAIYSVGTGFTAVLPNVLANRILVSLRAWEKVREVQYDVDGIPVDQWETMFRIST